MSEGAIRKFTFTGFGSRITLVDEIPSKLKIHHGCRCCESVGRRKVDIWARRKKREYRDDGYMVCDGIDTYIIGPEKMKELVKTGTYNGCFNFGGEKRSHGGIIVIGDSETINFLASKGRDLREEVKEADRETLKVAATKAESKTEPKRDIAEPYAFSLATTIDDPLDDAGKFFDCHLHAGEKLCHCNACTPHLGFGLRGTKEMLYSKYAGETVLSILERRSRSSYSRYRYNDIGLPGGKLNLVIVDGEIVCESSLECARREGWEETGMDLSEIEPVGSNDRCGFVYFIFELPSLDKLAFTRVGDSPETWRYIINKLD